MGKININIATGSLQKKEIIVGIDLGTTNSLVSFIHPETSRPVVLKEHDSGAIVPSIIHFSEGQKLSVGERAKYFLTSEPENTIFSIKRLMGKSYRDISERMSLFSYKIIDDGTDNLVKIQVGDKFYSPIELSSYILEELKRRAEHILKTPVTKAVITVPAYFNDSQRQATRDAGRLAGLDVLRIINEPTAASLAYGIGLDKNTSRTIAVYDLGGGTFDISLLKITDGIFEVLATNGNTYLGGDDFDYAIFTHWIRNLNIDEARLNKDKTLVQELRLKAEDAKKFLSNNSRYLSLLDNYELQLDINEFENLIRDMVEQTLACCRDALDDASLSMNEIDEVIMVGGSTRVPLVKKMVSDFFGKPLHDSLDPDEVVALGAAVQADILAGNNKEFLLLDITPLSLGIETLGGLMDVIIPRNSKIPHKAARQYTTQKDGQAGMRISVFQGERDLVQNNRKLAEFILSGIPGMPAGFPKVEVTFLINADGILTVSAKELRSGVEQAIEVRPQYGLTDADVEKLLLDSINHASEDMKLRALIEAQTEASQILATTEQFISKNKGFLTQIELDKTIKAIDKLKTILPVATKDEIRNAVENLNDISRTYAERLMDEAIGAALKGKTI